MIHMRKYAKKTIFCAVVLLLLLFGAQFLTFSGKERLAAWAMTLTPEIYLKLKSDVVMDDNDRGAGSARKANVLFLLDTGSPMTFTSTGKMPVWGTAAQGGNVTSQTVAGQMLRDCTYGHGGLAVVGGNSGSKAGYSRYGREDLNPAGALNNMTPGNTNLNDHLDNYYSPFNYPNNPLGANPKPYALVFRNPNFWENPPASFGINDLVPNDSRMYKMKLVMWRVLSDTLLLENLRIGMATTFQEYNIRTASYVADFYKDNFQRAREGYGIGQYTAFPSGTGPSWATNLPDGYSDSAGGYYNSEYCYWGIDRDYYSLAQTSMTWRLINRAYLRVPIADYSDEHVALFRMWIDGYENVNTAPAGSPYFFVNPELTGDGKTFLSTAIYSGHTRLSRATLLAQMDAQGTARGVAFSQRTGGNDLTTSVNTNTRNNCRLTLKAGTGEAVGSILDFFSPPVNGIDGITTDATNVRMAPNVSFPLTDPCDKNWVVIFTAGDDSSEYSAETAVRQLYEHTRDNQLTRLTGRVGTNNQFSPIRLDDGIRTLVVGFVDPDSTDSDVVGLRTRLTAMAKAGDPGNDDAKAYFANDVPGLIAALRSVLVRINNDIQPAKGPMLESSSFMDQSGPDVFNLFAATYRINNYDVWEGSLTRYEATKNASGDLTVSKRPNWELNENLIAKRNAQKSSRSLLYWKGGVLTGLDYTGPVNNSTAHPTANLTGLTDAKILSMDISTIPGGFTGRIHPSRALIDWLYGFDVSYVDRTHYNRKFMLSDFGQSGVTMVGPPEVVDSLPNFMTWAQSKQSIEKRLYAQTNDGILHVINPLLAGSSGSKLEDKAIVPPPVLLPTRLGSVKMSFRNDKYWWVDINDFVATQSEDIPISARPVYLLDGPVQKRYFDIGGWGTYLVATLGRAGSGLYLMDITAPQNPKFYWYRETLEDDDGKLTLLRMGATMDEPVQMPVSPDASLWTDIMTTPKSYPYYQLGFNSPKPQMGVAKDGNTDLRNMIVLAGGLQNRLDLDDNGKMGAALYIVDPNASKQNDFDNTGNGTIVFNSGSLKTARWRVGNVVTGKAPYMGMMVSEPTLLRSKNNKYLTGKIFASDNRGNIFMVAMENEDGTPRSVADWDISTIATLRLPAEAETTDSYSIPYGLVLGTKAGDPNTWIAGGTANVGTKGNSTPTGESDPDDPAMIKNKMQMLFCFKMPEITPANSTLYRNSFTQINLSLPDSGMNDGDKGWFVPLQGEAPGFGEEYASTQPGLFGGVLYMATFIPEEIDVNSTLCSDRITGKSRLYALDMSTGKANKWAYNEGSKKYGKKYLEIEGIKITGFTHSQEGSKQTLLITYDVLDFTKASASIEDVVRSEKSLSKVTGMDALSETLDAPQNFSLKNTNSVINYWLRQ